MFPTDTYLITSLGANLAEVKHKEEVRHSYCQKIRDKCILNIEAENRDKITASPYLSIASIILVPAAHMRGTGFLAGNSISAANVINFLGNLPFHMINIVIYVIIIFFQTFASFKLVA